MKRRREWDDIIARRTRSRPPWFQTPLVTPTHCILTLQEILDLLDIEWQQDILVRTKLAVTLLDIRLCRLLLLHSLHILIFGQHMIAAHTLLRLNARLRRPAGTTGIQCMDVIV